MKERAGILGRLQEQDVVVLLGNVVAEGTVARRHQVRVRVNQAGEDRAASIFSPLHRHAIGDAHIGLAPQGDDAVILHEQGRLFDGHGARPIEEAGGCDQGETGGSIGHGGVSSRWVIAECGGHRNIGSRDR